MPYVGDAMINADLPQEAEVIERVQETHSVFNLRLMFTNEEVRQQYSFEPGQFNMVYLYGIGEVPISIVSDPMDGHMLDHAIRAVGRVTKGLARLKAGDRIGLRGPFGRGWPLRLAQGCDVVVITGGLGCAPVISVVNYIIQRRERFGHLTIMQGVKLPADLIWRDKYELWSKAPDTQVFLAADADDKNWPWHVGQVTELFDGMVITENTIVMMCGPEGMMRACIHELHKRQVADERIYLSMERNMQCGVGRCGHCQFGAHFICRQGPVFSLAAVRSLLGEKGF